MYSSRGNNNSYGQQQQQQPKPDSYSTHLGPDGASQIPLASRHPALLGGHLSSGAHYTGQYASVYGSSALNSALQVPAASVKGAGSSVFEGRSGYGSTMQDSPKYNSENYPAATQKYAERSSAYSGRDLQTESAVRLADSLAFAHQHQTDIYDRLDAATALRKELLDGSSRQGDYLAARAATVRQELLPYGARMDAADLHTLSMISGTQHPPSILGAAPRRDMEDLLYTHTYANPGYGVSLPPGRAYASAKSLHGTSLDSDYPGGILARAGYARLDDRKDDVEYAREIERREEDRRREILRDRERDRERDRDRDRERERQRERDRERDRERERERERRRERERDLERREKDRERESKRGSEIRRDRSPVRSSRDRGRSSSAKALRSVRRESPVKEKRREYDCKVYSSNLVDPERDYLSMDKRYPRLYVPPECAKVVVNWSREDLKVPFNTPISFEHDFVQEETPSEHESASKKISDGHVKLESGATRWNAKMLLMSGLSQNAWEELSSERKYEDRIPHLCNMLRFAFLKDRSSCMAIGGSWDTVDGNDPAVDKSTLVQTVLRHAKELTGLDLKNCRHWNPFLEIHYDRVGKDGLFSHKEVTVLYIPDLTDCLPSIDAWRDQWLAHKKAVAERERLHALKREKLLEKKEVPKDKETKDLKKPEKKKESGSASKVNGKGKVGTKVDVKAKESGKEGVKTVVEKKDVDKTVVEKKDGDKPVIEKKVEVETVNEGNKSGKKNPTDNTDVQTPGSGSGKKKIIRKVIKKKVAAEKDGAKNTEVIAEAAEPSTTPTKNKATKKAPVVKTVKKEDEVKEPESDVKEKKEDVVGSSVKTIVKKKIIKRIVKRKIAAKGVNNKDKVATENETGSTIGEQTASEVKLENDELVSEAVPQSVVPEQRKDEGRSREVGNKSEKVQVKEEKKAKAEGEKKAKVEGGGSDKNVKSKDVKEKKDKDVKTETKVKDVKDKKKTEDPPRHPGLILQTKGSTYSKLRSLSLSLDSLLDYSDKDVEESTFELSVFAETYYEMLQYQMGSRILKFLQKLRIKFVTKRNQKKRQREELSKKEKEKSSGKKSPHKRHKTEDVTVERKSVKTETLQEGGAVDDKTVVKDEKMLIDNVENPKPEDGTDKDEDPEEEDEEEEEEVVEEVVEEEEEEEEEEEVEEEEEEEEDPEEDSEEDPEEDPEEDENMADANPENDVENEEKAEVEKVNMDVKSENVDEKGKDDQEEKAKFTSKSEVEKKEKKENRKVDSKKKEIPLDKQLLQAFRFFDRNRVGYVRVEDLRLILHALGKCMSHRDAKELVQSALLESNTGRDDRILYTKLVKMTDI